MKKNRTSKIGIAFFSFLLLMSCSIINRETITGEGKIVSKTITLSAFTDVELQNHCDVEIVVGTENKVEVSDHENIIDYLEFKVIGNKLLVKSKQCDTNINNSKAKATIYLAGKLKSLAISGSGNIFLKNQLDGIENIAISGSGDIKSESFSKSDKLSIAISGSGDVDFSLVESQNANCTISGSGDIKVFVLKSLKVGIAGSGDVHYKGEPTIIKGITGSGEIVKM